MDNGYGTVTDVEQGRLRALGKTLVPGGWLASAVAAVVAALAVINIVLALLWSNEPDAFDVQQSAAGYASDFGRPVVVGSTTTATLIRVAETLLEKPGGYLGNDVLPPGVALDNMPNWEFGALVQVRDLAKAMRETLSRSQSQSKEDPDLVVAEPQFNFDSESWILPATESEYTAGIARLRAYARRLADSDSPDAQFYARADNLRYWLGTAQSRLGSLSQRLSASVGKAPLNTALAGDPAARQSTPAHGFESKTPWYEIDDVGADPFPQGRRDRLRRRAGAQERGGQPAPDHPRTGGDPGTDVEPGDPQRFGFRSAGQPLAGDGLVHLACQRRGDRSARTAGAGLSAALSPRAGTLRAAASGLACARHRPEQTPLYRLVEQHCPAFVAHLTEQGRALPAYVEKEFESCLKCGRLEHGLLRVHCAAHGTVRKPTVVKVLRGMLDDPRMRLPHIELNKRLAMLTA